MIKVNVASPQWKKGDSKGMLPRLVALLDTGADLGGIDSNAASALGLVAVGSIETVQFGSVHKSAAVPYVVGINNFPHSYNMTGQVNDLKRTQTTFDLILGMAFLHMFDFRVNRSSGSVILISTIP